MALSKPTGKLAFAYQSIAILEAARKQDDALIRQLVDALDDSIDDSRTVLAEDQLKYMARYKPERLAEQQRIVTDADAALTAARKRLEGTP